MGEHAVLSTASIEKKSSDEGAEPGWRHDLPYYNRITEVREWKGF